MAKTVTCSSCGAVCTTDLGFCPYCNARLEKPSFFKKVMLPILQGLGFFGFYYAVQSAVTVVFTFIAMLSDISGLLSNYSDSFPEYLEDALNWTLEAMGRYMPAIGFFSAAITILGYFFFFKIRKKSFFKEIKIRPIRPTTCVAMFSFGLCALILVSVGLAVLYTVFPDLAPYSNSEAIDQLLSGGNPVLQFLNISVVTGIIEETIFRGLIYTNLRKSLPVGISVLISAVIFGAAHMNIEQFFYTALLGALMALVYEKYKTIFAPIIVHATFNGSNYLLDVINFKNDMGYIAVAILALGIFLITFAIVFFSKRESLSEKN